MEEQVFTSHNKQLTQNALFGHFGLRKIAVGVNAFVQFDKADNETEI